ncbi:MAG: hypothetical protein ABI318_10090 [Chthoniobacteraceae bacterium]
MSFAANAAIAAALTALPRRRGDRVQIVLASTAFGLLTVPLWLRIGFAWLGL